MDNLLTARQLQEILQVDRITVYRMLADGRLAGVKVGGQWRFREADLQELLATRTPSGQGPHSILPLPCVQAMQDVFAQALDVAVVVTDMAGVPITNYANSCQFCDLILSTAAGRQRCQACWADVSQHTRHRSTVYRCHAGLSYTRGLIEVDGRAVGIVVAGQFALAGAPQAERDTIACDVSQACAIPLASLLAAYPTAHSLDEHQAKKVLALIETMATAVCRIGHERQRLLSRLDRISAISSEQ